MGFDTSQISQFGNLLTTFNSPQKRTILTFNGYREAQDFKLNRGESIIALDSNEDVLYLKECDDIGKYSLKVFSCIDVTNQIQEQNNPTYITKSDLDSFSNNLLSEVKKMIGGNSNGKLDDKKQ